VRGGGGEKTYKHGGQQKMRGNNKEHKKKTPETIPRLSIFPTKGENPTKYTVPTPILSLLVNPKNSRNPCFLLP